MIYLNESKFDLASTTETIDGIELDTLILKPKLNHSLFWTNIFSFLNLGLAIYVLVVVCM